MDKNGKVTNGPYWTQNWIEAMWRFTAERFVNFDTGAVDFEAIGREEYEFRKALFFRNFKNSPRAKKVFDEANGEYKKKVENGSKGGRPRKENGQGTEARLSQGRAGADSVRGTPLHSAPARTSGTMPDYVQQVYDFAAAENLDPVDAYECWNVTVNERGGKTADGKRITNWKAYVRKWCATRASNREES